MVQDELIKYFERVQARQDDRTAVDVGCRCRCVLCDPQAVVDHLKQYDKDNRGALSAEEVQAAIRGTVTQSPLDGLIFERRNGGFPKCGYPKSMVNVGQSH